MCKHTLIAVFSGGYTVTVGPEAFSNEDPESTLPIVNDARKIPEP